MTDSPTTHFSSPRGWLLAAVVAGFAFLAATMVPVQTTTAGDIPEVDIQASTDGISVDFFATTPRNVLTFSVRVVGPDGFVFEQRVEDAALQWIPPDDLADGIYSWEAWVVTADVGAQMRELTPALEARAADHWFDNEVKQTHLASGSFKVENGLLENTGQLQSEDAASSRTRRVAGAILDFLLPSAQADDFGGDRASQFLSIDDANSSNHTRITLFNSSSILNDGIVLRNLGANFRLGRGLGGATVTDLFTVLQGGNVGIGTTAPLNRLHIVDFLPLRLDDGFGNNFRLNIGGTGLWFLDRDNESVVKMNHSATTDALVVDGAGIGMGTFAPAAPLHVQRANNTAQVRVEDSGSSNQTMFLLTNNGHPRFRLQNTSGALNVNWEFRTAGSGVNEQFQINRLVEGEGGVQLMRLLQNGNLVIEGTLTQGSSRAVKEGIVDLDPVEVLARLDGLSLHEWSYQRAPDQRHLGPMAEDFYAVFGLGGSRKHIAPGDLAGVALAAAKGLAERSATLEADNAELRKRLERLEAMLLSSM